MRFHPSPKQVFAFVSLALITVIGATTSVSQAVFFREARRATFAVRTHEEIAAPRSEAAREGAGLTSL